MHSCARSEFTRRTDEAAERQFGVMASAVKTDQNMLPLIVGDPDIERFAVLDETAIYRPKLSRRTASGD